MGSWRWKVSGSAKSLQHRRGPSHSYTESVLHHDSGHMRGHTLGSGGGGAFVEALISVRSGERIEITVGGGGAAGQNGLDPDDPNLSDEFRNGDGCLGIASGGQPGGGTGYSGNLLFACGGGKSKIVLSGCVCSLLVGDQKGLT